MKEIIFKYMKEHGFGEFNPKAVLFDMDGVLYNSMPNHAVAWQESMKQFDNKELQMQMLLIIKQRLVAYYQGENLIR